MEAKAEADFLAEVSRSPQQGLPERFCRGSEDTEMDYERVRVYWKGH